MDFPDWFILDLREEQVGAVMALLWHKTVHSSRAKSILPREPATKLNSECDALER